jgi:hypothetical protein
VWIYFFISLPKLERLWVLWEKCDIVEIL